MTLVKTKGAVNCVDFAKEIFDTKILTTSFYSECLEISKLMVDSVEVLPYFSETAKTQASVRVHYSNLAEGNKPSEALANMKVLELFVVSNIESINHAFKTWRNDFKHRMFKGKVPLTVAIDVNKRVVYLVVVHDESVELQLFGELSKEDLAYVLEDLSYDKPIQFRLRQEVLMDIISGDEGYKYAYDNLEIAFNCSTEIILKNKPNL